MIFMGQRVPRVLYHYCSLSTFKSIFDNKSIWLSDIRRSNDSLELQWIMGQCQTCILKAWVNYARSVQNERGMEIITSDHFEQFEKLYNLAKSYEAVGNNAKACEYYKLIVNDAKLGEFAKSRVTALCK